MNGTLPPGERFFKRILLEPGALAGEGPFSTLVVSYKGGDGRPEKIRLTQLMIASPQSVFHVEHAGWNEVEYSDQMQRRWQWTTARAETFVNSAGRDLTLRIAGESPLRYFDKAPHVTIRAGNQVLATAQPSTRLRTRREGAGLSAGGLGWDADDRNRRIVRAVRTNGQPRSPDAWAAVVRADDPNRPEDQKIRSHEIASRCQRGG